MFCSCSLALCFIFLEKEILAHWDPRSLLFLVTSPSFPRPLALFCMNHCKLDLCWAFCSLPLWIQVTGSECVGAGFIQLRNESLKSLCRSTNYRCLVPQKVSMVKMRSRGWFLSQSSTLIEEIQSIDLCQARWLEDSGERLPCTSPGRDPRNDLPMPLFWSSFQSYEEIALFIKPSSLWHLLLKS